MKKLLIACCAALALSGCAPGLLAGLGGQPPAPLAATTIDDRALEKGWQAFDLALDAIDLLGDFGIIKPGTPTGKAVATGIRATNSAFATAERAAAAGSARDYATALAEIDATLKGLRATVAAIKGSK